jgi:hypothetical protein
MKEPTLMDEIKDEMARDPELAAAVAAEMKAETVERTHRYKRLTLDIPEKLYGQFETLWTLAKQDAPQDVPDSLGDFVVGLAVFGGQGVARLRQAQQQQSQLVKPASIEIARG